MKIKKLLVMTFLSLFAATGVNAQQPYSGCWHPDDIKNWSPETDPDAKYQGFFIAIGMANKSKETAALSAVVGFLLFHTVIGVILKFQGHTPDNTTVDALMAAGMSAGEAAGTAALYFARGDL